MTSCSKSASPAVHCPAGVVEVSLNHQSPVWPESVSVACVLRTLIAVSTVCANAAAAISSASAQPLAEYAL